jgi:tRNA A37 N6-isopentenylltransferase MiaA
MAKYINADEILNKISDDHPYKSSLKLELIQATPEDIASGDAEMCGLSFAFQLMEAEKKGKALMQKHDSEVKREVARKIFEEIEDLLHKHYVEWDFCYFDDYLGEDFDELKKKYTEGE